MFVQINREHDEKYIYQQIYEVIKNQILQRILAVHEKLYKDYTFDELREMTKE